MTKVFLFILGFVIYMQFSFSDIVYLKDGGIITGNLLSQDDLNIKIKSKIGIYTIDNIIISKSIVDEGSQFNLIKMKRPIFKWAFGGGVPYAIMGQQFGLVFNDQFEMFLAFTALSNNAPAWAGSDIYSIQSIGLKWYLKSDDPNWIPGTGIYLSPSFMSYSDKYSQSTPVWNYPGYTTWQTTYNETKATIAALSIGFDGKYWIFHTNIELGYAAVLSSSGGSISVGYSQSGPTFALGLGVAF